MINDQSILCIYQLVIYIQYTKCFIIIFFLLFIYVHQFIINNMYKYSLYRYQNLCSSQILQLYKHFYDDGVQALMILTKTDLLIKVYDSLMMMWSCCKYAVSLCHQLCLHLFVNISNSLFLVEFPHIILKLTTVQPLSRQIVISSCSLALFLHPINHQGCYQCSTQTWIIKTTVYFLAHPNNWQHKF